MIRANLGIVEIFGPTLQGEGQVIGRKTLFIRFAGCDYACLWCDSAFTWKPGQIAPVEHLRPHEVLHRLLQLDPQCRDVTLSGGNPALYDLTELVEQLGAHGYRLHVETQGSRAPAWLGRVDSVTISPKPPSSGMDTDWALLQQTVAVSACPDLKVVVFDEADYDYARDLRVRFPNLPFALQVGNRVGDDDTAALLQKLDWLAQRALSDPTMQNVRILPQLHVLLWGNRRGV